MRGLLERAREASRSPWQQWRWERYLRRNPDEAEELSTGGY